MLPQEPELVVGNIARFRRWLRGARGGDYDFPVLEPDQARDFCDLARFMRVLSLPGQVQVPLAHWPDFYAILTGGFHLGCAIRGEQHLARVSRWLRSRYPVSFAPDSMIPKSCADEHNFQHVFLP